MSKSPSRARRGPQVVFDGAMFRVAQRGRSVEVPAVRDGEDAFLVELDDVTHWAAVDGGDPQEISIDDLGAILEAIENFAEDEGFSISFE